MPVQMIALVNPPQGRSLSNEYAEKCMQLAENKMKFTVTELEKRHQRSVSQLNKEKQSIARDLKKIRTNTGSYHQPPTASKFLEMEKERLKNVIENTKRDEYRSDGNSSEDSWDERSESDVSLDSFIDGEDAGNKTHRKFQRQSKASYEERSREERLTNLHRRYSAQINAEIRNKNVAVK